VEEYIRTQLDSIGRATVSLIKQPLKKALQTKENWQQLSLTASSLRLDTVISAIYNISRQKSQVYIQQGVVKVN
ncbi:hypothetical protein, partial [Escherichia coli]|uniref:hypothetical protein n=1 Tax=Escherichia coli TaxID=562 RepID=UPI001967FD1D